MTLFNVFEHSLFYFFYLLDNLDELTSKCYTLKSNNTPIRHIRSSLGLPWELVLTLLILSEKLFEKKHIMNHFELSQVQLLNSSQFCNAEQPSCVAMLTNVNRSIKICLFQTVLDDEVIFFIFTQHEGPGAQPQVYNVVRIRPQ